MKILTSSWFWIIVTLFLLAVLFFAPIIVCEKFMIYQGSQDIGREFVSLKNYVINGGCFG